MNATRPTRPCRPAATTGPDPTPTPTTFQEALEAVTRSVGPQFPADRAAAAGHYRRLARLLHPDTAPPAHRAAAQSAFTRLTAAWKHHRTGAATVLTTRRRTFTLAPGTFATGDLAVLREARYQEDGHHRRALLKIPREPRDNALLEREAAALSQVGRRTDPAAWPYFPCLIESFRHRESGTGAERRINALATLRGRRFVSLAEVREAYPDGVDPRDAAWMWRRLLVALGHAHRAGIRHGAVLPEHVLIEPEDHGLVLIDWCYSTTGPDTPAPALVEHRRPFYPPEVTEHRPVTTATDIHLATRCMQHITADGARLPAPMRAFARGSTLPDERKRPHDAWRLLREYDELLERLYGHRTWRPFHMP